MNEGWVGDQYVILFDAKEVPFVSEKYKIGKAIPGYEIAGLIGWDDFMLRDANGQTYKVPTVPLDSAHIESFEMPNNMQLKDDSRFTGKIKWYVKPIIFGGDPQGKENLIWVTHNQHVELVNWWNETYNKTKNNKT